MRCSPVSIAACVRTRGGISKPIPISTAACGYVVAMHSAANDFQAAYPLFGVVLDARGNQVPWPPVRARLARAADVQDFSVAASVPHFPAEVQRYLLQVRADIAAGREQVVVAPDGITFWERNGDVFHDGQVAFGYAGDLIGRQCRVQLGADSAPLVEETTSATRSHP